MSNHPNLFFESSQSVTERLGELFNFIWPTAAALWNLRWQVQGFVDAVGRADNYELNARFVQGSGITSADLKSSCISKTWDEQKEQFAKFLLFELCSLYEAWLEDVVPRVVSKEKERETLTKALQFPTSTGAKLKGLRAGIALVNAKPSTLLKSDFLPALVRHPKNSWSNIEALLTAYRYFKEARNVLIHGGGVAEQRVLNAHGAFTALPHASLSLKRPPDAPAVVLDERIRISLDDVVAFSSIVHRIIVTMDAALAVSEEAESDLLTRLRTRLKGGRTLSTTDMAKRERQIFLLLSKARLPKPISTVRLDPFLVSNRVIA